MRLHTYQLFFNPSDLPDSFSTDRRLNSDAHGHYTRSSLDFHRQQQNSTYSIKISSNIGEKTLELVASSHKD